MPTKQPPHAVGSGPIVPLGPPLKSSPLWQIEDVTAREGTRCRCVLQRLWVELVRWYASSSLRGDGYYFNAQVRQRYCWNP
jgi:hypothetical protein